MQLRLAACLAFVSGFVALGYEILWSRRLADVIGATALASSLVVSVFFVLLAIGAITLGPLATRVRSPWRLYALLEAGILLAVLPAFFADRLAAFAAHLLGDALLRPGVSLALKTGLALVFVGPASFLMGGTLPAMGQAVVRAGGLGRDGNLLYGSNTLGGAFGVLVTTFMFAPTFGMHGSFAVLMLGSGILALLASILAKSKPQDSAAAPEPAFDMSVSSSPMRTWLMLACVSGFNVLGLEILALHLFAQVLHNSVYTFATVLLIVIAALAVPALLMPRLRLDAPAALDRVLLALFATAFATALVPRVFVAVTHGMQPLGGGVATLGGYVLRILGIAALVLGPSFVLAGWVFPLVLAGASSAAGGRVATHWGRLLGINAMGALLGAVLANFVGMRFLGLWVTIALWSATALIAGLILVPRASAHRRVWRLGFATAATLALVLAWPGSLPVTALGPGDALLAWRAGPDGIATAVTTGGTTPNRRIKLNNTYTLGGIANAAQQARMGHLALLLHPRPHRVAFIGIATGITASAALRDPQVESLTAVELSPEVTSIACREFADANADLCSAPQSKIVVEDGRMFFRATRATFDVIVSDLFVPWQAGTANLYTQEQFEAVRARLAPDGLFAQWLPLFQLDEVGFWGIAATFASVFPNAWLAVADFQPYNPAVALIGWRDPRGAPSRAILEHRCRTTLPLVRWREPMLADATGVATFLVGPIGATLPAGIPLMTLDRPWLADHAPRVQRARPERWFRGPSLVASLQHIAANVRDDSLRAAISLGQKLYEYCEIADRDGVDRATRWLDASLDVPLPETNFRVDRPERLNWPFRRESGMVLLERARAGPDSAGTHSARSGLVEPRR